MSASQRTHFILIRQILRQLCAFGLNPRDWKIDRATLLTANNSESIFHLHHRRDRDFQMRAQVAPISRGSAKLQTLRVVSL